MATPICRLKITYGDTYLSTENYLRQLKITYDNTYLSTENYYGDTYLSENYLQRMKNHAHARWLGIPTA